MQFSKGFWGGSYHVESASSSPQQNENRIWDKRQVMRVFL